jgi:hypothetical protein
MSRERELLERAVACIADDWCRKWRDELLEEIDSFLAKPEPEPLEIDWPEYHYQVNVVRNREGRHSTLGELIQVVATAAAALQQEITKMNREQINQLFKEIYPDASCQEKLTACGFAQTISEMARKEALDKSAAICDDLSEKFRKLWKEKYYPHDQGQEFGADACSLAIRSMIDKTNGLVCEG